jgi:hypothetical protein
VLFRSVAGDADGRVGEVIFPNGGNGATFLAENEVDPALGLTRDLNGDGAIDALDHSGDYRLLPVRVRVAWSGATGDRQIELEALLCLR